MSLMSHLSEWPCIRTTARSLVASGVSASGGYQPEAISVLSVHDAVPTRISPIPAA